ncbi:UPF0271 protein [Agaricicola taiwanensis]|uniref:UPF0271 protein n=1 Tax=Agaricicola taiwanensis TaxID=591372 RepID=A0A8J2YJU0_9RHOB|nr:5-oxoprolinase subunit PxpA [Agaricicola taiwanensis]GGE48502.1 UPF0271 protein [Agaricicola taiwanensis]
MKMIDLNCDCGESWGSYVIGNDAAMLDIVTSANIACGFHGGDPLVLHRTLRLAKERGVNAGAHPSFLDPWGFGRRRIEVDSLADLEKIIMYQLAAFCGMAATLGVKVSHVKAHGALSNMAATDFDLSLALCRGVKAIDRDLVFFTSPGDETEKAIDELGLAKAIEIFADRAYDESGGLMARKRPGAVIHDADTAAKRIIGFLEDQAITTVDGRRIPTLIDTICVHGDNPHGVEIASKLRSALEQAGWTVAPLAAPARSGD